MRQDLDGGLVSDEKELFVDSERVLSVRGGVHSVPAEGEGRTASVRDCGAREDQL